MTRRWPVATAALLVLLAVAPSASAAARPTDRTWHGVQIKAYDAQSAGRFGRGVTVAVLDGWVDRTHPDFEGRALVGADCTSGTCTAGQAQDKCDHGTHVAGTVGSTSFGIASKATILPVRVLAYDSKGECTGTPAVVAAGIRWAIAQGADVLNLSLGPDVPGLGSTSEIPTAVHEAAVAGAVVIFSAGNADLPVAQAYGNDALVVAATGPNGKLASYSQHDQGVSVAAPGGQPGANDQCTQAICVTSLFPRGQYSVAAGTSMAAPHVSGIAALLFGQSPTRGRQSVMDRITGTAHPLAGAGSGLVDAWAALGLSATPGPVATRTTAAATQTPTVKARVTAPRPTATASRPAASTPTVRPTPTPTPSATSELPSTAPTPAQEVPPVALPVRTDQDDSVPLSLAALAGVLVGLAGAGVLALPRLTRPTRA